MKNPNNLNSKKGFTLVELLVVIAIIAVLAAAGFAGGTAAMNKARKVTAQASATSVQTAIEQFYAEYSALPDVAEQTDTSSGALLNILAGLETGSGNSVQNDRKIRFLSLKESKNGKRDGVVYSANGNSMEKLLDPWGQPFYVVLDTDYDDKVEFTPQGNSKVTLNGRRAAVYSLGVESVGEAKPSSLVKTW